MVIFSLKSALEAQKLNSEIFETIYYHTLKSSSELSSKDGPYETYDGSPASKVGVFILDVELIFGSVLCGLDTGNCLRYIMRIDGFEF